jgi:hypothetical protein
MLAAAHTEATKRRCFAPIPAHRPMVFFPFTRGQEDLLLK